MYAMYVNKLDGKIPLAFYDAKAAEWKREQEKVMESIKSHLNANHA